MLRALSPFDRQIAWLDGRLDAGRGSHRPQPPTNRWWSRTPVADRPRAMRGTADPAGREMTDRAAGTARSEAGIRRRPLVTPTGPGVAHHAAAHSEHTIDG